MKILQEADEEIFMCVFMFFSGAYIVERIFSVLEPPGSEDVLVV